MKLKLRFSLILSVLFYALFLRYLFLKIDLQGLHFIFNNASWSFLFVALLAGLGMIYFQALLLHQTFGLYNLKIKYFESLSLWLLGVAASTFTVGLGGPAVLYFKIRKKGDLHLTAKIMTAFYLFYVIPNLTFVVLGSLLFFPGSIFKSDWLLPTILIAAILLSAIFILARNSSYFKQIFGATKSTFSRFSKFEIAKILEISTLEIVFSFLIFFFVLKAFGVQISLTTMIKNFVVVEILAIFSPTGGGVGAVELGLTGSLALSGVVTASAAIVVLTYRLINFWLPFLAGGILFGSQSKAIFADEKP
jgi:uncharacterized membrane protein YbhN (UPF0104 family)